MSSASRPISNASSALRRPWLVIHYLASNTTLVWVALGVPALLAGYTLADALTGSIGLGASFRNRRGGGRR